MATTPKPRMVEVSHAMLLAVTPRILVGDLDVPALIEVSGHWYANANADEWRAFQSTSTGES
jgi:hypothetical protein